MTWQIEAKNGSEWFTVGGPNNGHYHTKREATCMRAALRESMLRAGMRETIPMRVVKR